MARTQVELAREALKELTVIAADEDPSAADQQQMIDEYTDALQELEVIGLATWDANAIPNVVFRPLSIFLAARACRKFGKEYAADEVTAHRMIRAVVAKPYLGQPAQPEFM